MPVTILLEKIRAMSRISSQTSDETKMPESARTTQRKRLMAQSKSKSRTAQQPRRVYGYHSDS